MNKKISHNTKGKIIYILPYQFYFKDVNTVSGGHIAHIIGVVEAFIKKGYTVEIISDYQVPDLDSDLVFYQKPAFQFIRRRMYKLKYGGILSQYLFLLSLFWTTFARLLRKSTVLCYIRHNINGCVPVCAAKIARIPVILEVNTPVSIGATGDFSLESERKCKLYWREKIQYELSAVISVVSPVIQRWISKQCGAKVEKKILINPNGVDVEKFTPNMLNQSVRKQFGFKTDDIVIGMVASFRWYSAIDELIVAFNEACKELHTLKLILIGTSDLLDDLKQRVEKKRYKNIVFTGAVPNRFLSKYLQSCDILVSHFNFKKEKSHICSIKHLEYMASGLPIIASRAEYANFAIDHKKNGLLVRQGDIKDVTEAIVMLAKNPELRKKLGKQARIDAVCKHSWLKNVERILKKIDG